MLNRFDLKTILQKARIDNFLYNLDETGRDDERICLKKAGEKWEVYYSERGVKTTREFFDSESEACEYIYYQFFGMKYVNKEERLGIDKDDKKVNNTRKKLLFNKNNRIKQLLNKK